MIVQDFCPGAACGGVESNFFYQCANRVIRLSRRCCSGVAEGAGVGSREARSPLNWRDDDALPLMRTPTSSWVHESSWFKKEEDTCSSQSEVALIKRSLNRARRSFGISHLSPRSQKHLKTALAAGTCRLLSWDVSREGCYWYCMFNSRFCFYWPILRLT